MFTNCKGTRKVGTLLLNEISVQLTADFRKGYSETTLNILGDQSNETVIKESHTLRGELTWTFSE